MGSDNDEAVAKRASNPRPDDRFYVPMGTIIQLPAEEAVKWVTQQLESSAALRILHNHFSKEGYTFHIERSKVFVTAARDTKNNTVPSVLGILPSFVPTTAADRGHSAVGISVHDSGYAIAASVSVSHAPFEVTEFTLHEIEPGTRRIVSSTLSADAIIDDSVATLASRMHAPRVPKAGSAAARDVAAEAHLERFTVIDKGNQGQMIGAVVHQLLADNYSKSLFPPEYATALSMQTSVFQKFAFATSARFEGTVLGLTLCTSSSTSSNICTSTSTSTIEV